MNDLILASILEQVALLHQDQTELNGISRCQLTNFINRLTISENVRHLDFNMGKVPSVCPTCKMDFPTVKEMSEHRAKAHPKLTSAKKSDKGAKNPGYKVERKAAPGPGSPLASAKNMDEWLQGRTVSNKIGKLLASAEKARDGSPVPVVTLEDSRPGPSRVKPLSASASSVSLLTGIKPEDMLIIDNGAGSCEDHEQSLREEQVHQTVRTEVKENFLTSTPIDNSDKSDTEGEEFGCNSSNIEPILNPIELRGKL